MNISIKKENVKKYVAAATLACLVGTPVGLAIGCKKTDHTKELCPVTKVLNMLPDYQNQELEYKIPRGAKHQIEKLAEDSLNLHDDTMVYATYGKITYPEIFEKRYEDGTVEEYTGEYFAGEYGITANLEDGTKQYMVFQKDSSVDREPDFKLVRTSRK